LRKKWISWLSPWGFDLGSPNIGLDNMGQCDTVPGVGVSNSFDSFRCGLETNIFSVFFSQDFHVVLGFAIPTVCESEAETPIGFLSTDVPHMWLLETLGCKCMLALDPDICHILCG
jgi:hypothetical protein